MEETTALAERRPENNQVTTQQIKPSGDPLHDALMQICTDERFDVEKMNAVLAVIEKREAHTAKQAYLDAMAKCQADLSPIVKTAYNKQTNSKFEKLGPVLAKITPVLARHGLSVSFGEGQPPKENWIRVLCLVSHSGGHVETFHRDGPIDTKGPKGNENKTELHGGASTHTYLQRQAVCGAFAIPLVDDDRDGNSQVEYMTDDQAFELAEMLDACDAIDTGYKAKFMDWLQTAAGCDSLTACPAKRYDKIKAQLKKKLQGGGK